MLLVSILNAVFPHALIAFIKYVATIQISPIFSKLLQILQQNSTNFGKASVLNYYEIFLFFIIQKNLNEISWKKTRYAVIFIESLEVCSRF